MAITINGKYDLNIDINEVKTYALIGLIGIVVYLILSITSSAIAKKTFDDNKSSINTNSGGYKYIFAHLIISGIILGIILINSLFIFMI